MALEHFTVSVHWDFCVGNPISCRLIVRSTPIEHVCMYYMHGVFIFQPHCYFPRGIDNGSGHHAVGLVSQSIFNVDNTMLDSGNVVMFCCWPKPSSKDMSPVQAGPLSINFPGS